MFLIFLWQLHFFHFLHHFFFLQNSASFFFQWDSLSLFFWQNMMMSFNFPLSKNRVNSSKFIGMFFFQSIVSLRKKKEKKKQNGEMMRNVVHLQTPPSLLSSYQVGLWHYVVLISSYISHETLLFHSFLHLKSVCAAVCCVCVCFSSRFFKKSILQLVYIILYLDIITHNTHSVQCYVFFLFTSFYCWYQLRRSLYGTIQGERFVVESSVD